MRIVVIGATGNAGTAVLRALKNTPEVTSITGIARRLPDTTAEPYVDCEWVSVDVGAEEAVTHLSQALAGADAVIHLAWLIQPNDRRELLHQVNVTGTRHVAEAVAAAGVPHLVVACSVGSYAPDETRDGLRDESWPATGITSSHYSSDKADQERVLDEFSAQHPEIIVTRLRPGLIFQGDAGAEIQRYFLGPKVPVQLLKAGKLPTLPLPKGIQVQAVHSDDVARAYAAAVVKRAPGAFNVCADDILGPQELADIVDHGHFVELPPALVRGSVKAAHKSGALAADEGWIDMAMQVPLMDNTRARTELGWEPRHTAAEALKELFEGLISGRGAPSVPLRPRSAEVTSQERPEVPERIDRELLELYLSDHLSGATAGTSRMARMADDFVDTPVFPQLSAVAEELRWERSFLKQLIHDLGLKQLPYRQVVAGAAERVGRLKGNGRAISRSPMTMLLETELMRSAVVGKRGGWQVLREHAADLNLDPEVFDELLAQLDRQLNALDEVHAYARARALRADREIYPD
ncbi:hypothetical protein COCCU_05135 [Corynebacterium occultum]|uniref:NAD-dependent epimerase/dehydratase domain-containing protein n=1 Tax=Corynebacterium occultum TaxID=2675219 RepID=A0A6B8VS57_9CORY|nr:NAD-dependent epimerase/dehydratase family protein [Corynebacterium occultum]QGU06973.1 hypothetical protein COCCU_05135 [Corynebacterium occultum]